MNTEFWQNKAQHYPVFQPNLKDTLDILAFFAANGVDLGGDLLDIGCGTGRFALQLAFTARSVTGVDLSERMLEKLHAKAAELSLKNLTTHLASWGEFCDTCNESFDAIFASMTPALDDEAGLNGAWQKSKKHLCYIGWQSSQNELYAKIYALCGVTGGGVMPFWRFLKTAGEAGFEFVAAKTFSNKRVHKAAFDEAMADFKNQVLFKKGEFDEEKVAQFVRENSRGGEFVYEYERKNVAAVFQKRS